MAYKVKVRIKLNPIRATVENKRIILIVSRGDSAEIRVKPDGSLSLFKVKKEREEILT